MRMTVPAVRVDPLLRVGAVLAAAGLVDSLYLAWAKLFGGPGACAGIGDCDLVNSSRFSEVGGVPIAVLGALAYLGALAILMGEARRPDWALPARVGLFGISLAGFLYSAYLTYIEVAVLRAVCPFCVVSAVLMTGLLFVSILRLRSPLDSGRS
jgi:uncharacterized membrane protein